MLEGLSIENKQGAKIVICGVGGGGNNAVDRMIREEVTGVTFYCINTDKQQLDKCLTRNVVQIGENCTKGLGAGADPKVGAAAATESIDKIDEIVKDADMVFVTCGMGGGTGSGAAPIVAKLAKDRGILTVGAVTKPFRFEAKTRMDNALKGIEELKKNVDTLIVVPNDRLLQIVDRRTSLPDALKKADEVLQQGIQGITDLINKTGLINLDFADIKTVMEDKGLAHFGIGEGKGSDKCMEAVKAAINSPLLETTIENATHCIVNFSGDVGLVEASEASSYVQEMIGDDSTIIFGVIYDESMQDACKVTIIATGIEEDARKTLFMNQNPAFNMGTKTAPSKPSFNPGMSVMNADQTIPGRYSSSQNVTANPLSNNNSIYNTSVGQKNVTRNFESTANSISSRVPMTPKPRKSMAFEETKEKKAVPPQPVRKEEPEQTKPEKKKGVWDTLKIPEFLKR
ncbi:cell division protein FtsZ [Acetitomaculum ruminis DSM 5522]|uniref:Cell division protein FtsZ n=1 Tax=Acetitomaculum ruminis DSM 5522 TaxID=1120918 RepID=A0A1I0YRZ5_9FIRM|nr:cell division protein FtsZ [Acetitomaculum ruminis]SFB15992.1 cell division protein FtsZ [Acetitomaculum ruminis DSM 5522]